MKDSNANATTIGHTTTAAATSTVGNVAIAKGFKPEVSISKADFAKLDAAGFFTLMENRISVEHAQRVVKVLVASGRIKITSPETLANWTYKRVWVEGCQYKGPGKKAPVVMLTADEFAKLSSVDLGTLFEGNISVERAKAIVLELIRSGVVKPTEEELRDWSNNRVMPEGLTPQWTFGTGRGASKATVVIDGVVATA